MTILFSKWWDKDTKNFQIVNYKKAWKENGNKPRIEYHTNGAKKKNNDKCLDVRLILGYTIINYTNFAYNK